MPKKLEEVAGKTNGRTQCVSSAARPATPIEVFEITANHGTNQKISRQRVRKTQRSNWRATPRGKDGKGNGGGGGWKARSGGAAAVESDELMIEELKSQLLEQKAAATEARLKLLESQAAAKSQGWGL